MISRSAHFKSRPIAGVFFLNVTYKPTLFALPRGFCASCELQIFIFIEVSFGGAIYGVFFCYGKL